jgi:AcrR family transcriptional regulator
MSSVAQRSRQRERRGDTRRKILDAAQQFLRARPYRELSVETLMADTDLTRTSFYRHFDDLPQVVLRLLEEVGGELYEVADHWAATATADFEGAARTGLAGIVEFFERHGPIVRAIAEAASTDEQIEHGYRGFLTAFEEMAKQGLDAMVAGGQLESCDTRQLARALNLMNERYLLDQLGREPRGDPAVALATLERVWLGAVSAPQPSAL